jgi:ATP-dependent Lhr-like helicase
MSYKLLSEPVRKYVREQRWDSLRPIQAAAIERIITTDNNYILASRTASGKTEAAFLPIVSKTNFLEHGVQVLYISPLIALINDQFFRIEELCKNLEITVTKWHGEAKKSLKHNLIKDPNGIVLITPESIEAMFVNAPHNLVSLFYNLKYIVIDEIHSFIGTDRGIQLMSLLSRLQDVNKKKIIFIGLSATIGNKNYIEAKKITGDTEHTKILLDKEKKDTVAKFRYFKNETKELSLDLIKDLYKETSNNKVLVFPNSRGRTEEVAVKLRKISEKVNGHNYYYSHHSSVDKEIRESIEYFAKNNERFNFCISCTSTLELGIDIGTVDKIVQIDSTHSVSSLVQRIGRSGRKEGEKSFVTIYATNKWSFLQSLSCWQLYNSDFLEPIDISEKPYDILFHQMLSIVKQKSGISKKGLIKYLQDNTAFKNIELSELNEIIEESINLDYLELIQNELIIGIEGENIVNKREFYSVFKTEQNFKVLHKGRKIGDIPFSPQIKIDVNILLAAKIWKIIDIDFKGFKIEVRTANDGKKPMFFGTAGDVHHKVREEMLKIIKDDNVYNELDDDCSSVLSELRHDFKDFKINNIEFERPVIIKGNKIILYSFAGSKLNKTLHFLISLAGFEVLLFDHNSALEIIIEINQFNYLKECVNKVYKTIDSYIENEVKNNESILSFSKWGLFLPLKYKRELLKKRYFDLENSINFLNNLKLITMDSPLNFTAIDVETAQGPRWSICQIGLVKVENSIITDEVSFLIQPPDNEYSNWNIQIHGITPDKTKDSPIFPEIWDQIKPYIEKQLLVAHNAVFDIDCLVKTLELYDIEVPNFDYVCTMKPTGAKLKELCQAYNINLRNHHDALNDARACAQVFLKISNNEKPDLSKIKLEDKNEHNMFEGHETLKGDILKPDLGNGNPNSPFYNK